MSRTGKKIGMFAVILREPFPKWKMIWWRQRLAAGMGVSAVHR